MSSTERFILPASSGKIRRFAILSTMYARSAAPSPAPAPNSTSRPRPIAPVVRESTVTLARDTRCTTARMCPEPTAGMPGNPTRLPGVESAARMRAPMRSRRLVHHRSLAGCGKRDRRRLHRQLGLRSERPADLPATRNQKGGYCTIQGCDFDTCPSEAECVRFFTGQFDNQHCDPTMPRTATERLLARRAVQARRPLRAAQLGVRYCMRKCSSDGDCRDGYECRKSRRRARRHGDVLGTRRRAGARAGRASSTTARPVSAQ